MTEPRLILIGLLLLAGVAALFAVLFSRRSRYGSHPRPTGVTESPEPQPGVEVTLPAGANAANFRTGIAGRLLRTALLLLSLVVGASFIIIALPQGMMDWMAGVLLSRSAEAPVPEKIAFLYLGDELRERELHIRGVVRNIATTPIEKLDVTIRFYAPGGQLIETRSVRLDSDLIVPDQTAQFHLVYPDYGGQFATYSVEFVLRQGETVPYKDMRATRGRG